MTAAQRDYDLFSDIYKDLNGFRPRHLAARFMALPEGERKAWINRVDADLSREIAQEAEERPIDTRPWGEVFAEMIGV